MKFAYSIPQFIGWSVCVPCAVSKVTRNLNLRPINLYHLSQNINFHSSTVFFSSAFPSWVVTRRDRASVLKWVRNDILYNLMYSLASFHSCKMRDNFSPSWLLRIRLVARKTKALTRKDVHFIFFLPPSFMSLLEFFFSTVFVLNL